MSKQELPAVIEVIDSHTCGEPTRVVIHGGPDLGSGPLADRREKFRRDYDHFRSAVVNEPRGSDVIVGALLCEPVDSKCVTGTIFFNNAGFIGMCGHGTIGLMVTLLHLGRVSQGSYQIETPVGIVRTVVHDAANVTLENVPSYRHAKGVAVEVSELGRFEGDIAWGGNWFFLVNQHRENIELANAERLLFVTRRIRAALAQSGIFAPDGSELDHIELYGGADRTVADSRNFVLCPGGEYDRSPCGTGTSAKLACLAADGKLAPGQVWRQQGIVGGVFEASYRPHGSSIIPSITGSAYVCAHNRLLVNAADPFREGIRK